VQLFSLPCSAWERGEITVRLPYSLVLIGRERGRYLPAILAVAFCAQLNILQWGVLMGTLSVLSMPIDRSTADVWVASRDVLSLELAHPIPNEWESRVASQPAVERTEPYLFSFGYWHKPTGGSEVCTVIGSQLGDQALGALVDLTPQMRARLAEPGAVVVDAAELERLGIHGVGDAAEVYGHRVFVVGLLHGFKSVSGPFVICSLRTARMILPLFQEKPNDTMFLLARCRDSAAAHELIEHLRQYPDLSAFTRDEFSLRTRWYWLTQTNAGIGMGCTAGLALLVGLVVTSQTLYAATAASLREYAVLRALGISRLRMAAMVLAQSFWVGLFGIAVAMPVIFALGSAANFAGARVLLPTWLFAGGNALTMVMALVSGLMALRSLRLVEPIALLR
jgi:putative ABC transport system permease protein